LKKSLENGIVFIALLKINVFWAKTIGRRLRNEKI